MDYILHNKAKNFCMEYFLEIYLNSSCHLSAG